VPRDNVTCILPILNGKVLDVDMVRTAHRNAGINHLDSWLIVFLHNGSELASMLGHAIVKERKFHQVVHVHIHFVFLVMNPARWLKSRRRHERAKARTKGVPDDLEDSERMLPWMPPSTCA